MLARELGRRVSEVESRLQWLDEHGTRGVDAIRAAQQSQATDLGEIKGQIMQLGGKVDSLSGTQWPRVLGFAAVVAPIYILLFLAVFHVKAG